MTKAEDALDAHPHDHVVQFYEDEAFLVRRVVDSVQEALTSSHAFVVIATPDHRNAFEALLVERGIDPAEMSAHDRYLALDARETLGSFMVDGVPDPSRFFDAIGSVLDRLGTAGRSIGAFGEMVALLWEDGNVTGAIRLEELWNELAQTRAFSLLCAYPMSAFKRASDAAAFAEICATHSQVQPAEDPNVSLGDPLVALSQLQQRYTADRYQSELLREKQLELETALVRMEELDRLRNDFIAMVVHDIRSPNAVVGGFVNVLRENWRSLEEERIDDILFRVQEQTAHVSRLVDDMLTVSRLESGVFDYDLTKFDIAEVVYRAVGSVRDGWPDVTFELELGERLPVAYGDVGRQTQILNNLLSNAVKFSPKGSTVKVRIVDGGDHLVVSVTDEGPGISEQDQAKLFQRFTRLDVTSRQIKGTGLGLYITKALVEGQGGTVSLVSSPGRGSTFTYTVPTAR